MPQAKANGITIAYETFGAAGRPTVLLIMGFGAQMTLWPVSLCQGIADLGYQVIRFDNRDIGHSTHMDHLGPVSAMDVFTKSVTGQPLPPAPYYLDDMAQDAVGLLDALSIDRAHIVGASMGGMIAQTFAINHGNRARSLVSVMSSTGRPGLPQGTPEAQAALLTPPANLERETLIQNAIRTWKALGSPGYPASEAELRKVAEMQVDRTPYDAMAIARQLVATVSSPPRHELLAKVTCPTLVLHGADDPILPLACGEDTAKSIPGSKLSVIPGMGHDFTEALVPVYVREIGGFIRGVDGKQAAA